MLKEFKEFISKGNLVEIAVGLILALVIEMGDADLRYGAFLTTLLNFLIVAFVLFLVIKAYNRAFPKEAETAGPTEIELLTEIRDELRRR